MSLLTKIFGDPNRREINKAQPVVESVNLLESRYQFLSDEVLREQTELLRKQYQDGKTLDDILPDAFALVREASRRVLGMRHFDVQIIGGIFLHRGNIVEMRTGEGKTLVATLPIFLNALAGRGVHLVTVNDYLARRDAEWMGHIYDFLGLTVSCIQQQGVSYQFDKTTEQEIVVSERERRERGLKKEEKEKSDPVVVESFNEIIVEDEDSTHVKVEMRKLRPISRKEAYACDITYGTNNEFGFDYLRDNMVQEWTQKVQRELTYAIVDEVDSILIDEARTPLIISSPAEESTKQYYQFADLVKRLQEQEDYNVDEKMRAATLTEAGISKMEEWLGLDNIYVEGGVQTVHHIEQALKAHTLFKRDRDYVVKAGEVFIVDEFTGRIMYGRRYSEGLHQAIEAKEAVEIKRESQTMATITFQNYFRLYKKLSGMTGTALTEAEEFHKIYTLEVVAIPTNKSIIRHDLQDRIYKTEAGKFAAVIADIKERNERGQPVLVGTISIEKNEILGEMLARAGIPHEILNAKQHEKEAYVLAQAGKRGAVTVATNMAGRGGDIVLGGNASDVAAAEEVKYSGGLHVIGTERHESRRIDNQLRGRGGRQGDPGSSQFYVSCEDDLMRIFGSDRIKNLMTTLKIPDDMPIENVIISKSLESAQRRVEGYHFDIRKHLVEYDDVMNKHRQVIYKRRDEMLLAWEKERVRHGLPSRLSSAVQLEDVRDIREGVLDMIEDEITSVVTFHTAETDQSAWSLQEIIDIVKTIFPLSPEVDVKIRSLVSFTNQRDDTAVRQQLIDGILDVVEAQYDILEQSINELGGSAMAMRELEKSLILRAIDSLWVEHLDNINHLRTGIGLRGYGQRDPLVEYKKESYQMFITLLGMIQKDVVYGIFKVGAATSLAPSIMERAKQIFISPSKTMQAGKSGFDEAESTESSTDEAESLPKVGRNDPCPCGSGKKYKKCHGK